MLENIYRIDGQYPDPNQIDVELRKLKSDPTKEREYKESLSELESAGLDSHLLLKHFFVES